MRVSFQADADLNHTIVKATQRYDPAIDFRSAHAAGLVALSDQEVLTRAASAGRLLVSHDRKTMPGHFANFVEHSRSNGVIIVPQKLAISSVVEDLVLIWAASEAEEWINRIQVLPL